MEQQTEVSKLRTTEKADRKHSSDSGSNTAAIVARHRTNVRPASASSTGGPLSRLSVYTPLAAYNNARGIEPSEYMRQQQSTPKSIREATLTDFWQQVSEDYHRSLDSNFSKNTAARPLSSAKIEDQLRQRALTLVGGGFNTEKPTRAAGSQETSNGGRRKRLKRFHPWHDKPPSKGETLLPDVYQQQRSFLTKLNEMWNEWAWQVLGMNSAEVQATLTMGITTFEWVGARVRVDDCPQCSEAGTCGILIGETVNTWRLIEDTKPAVLVDRRALRTLVLPKDKSTLSVLLPAKQGDQLSGKMVCIKLMDHK